MKKSIKVKISRVYSLEIFFDGSNVIYRLKRYGTEHVRHYLLTLPTTLEMFGDSQNDILMSILEQCSGVTAEIDNSKPITVSVSSDGETVTVADDLDEATAPMSHAIMLLGAIFQQPRLVVMEIARLKVLQMNGVNNES